MQIPAYVRAVLALAIVCPTLASATQVLVRVMNVADSTGTVRVALCRKSEWDSHKCAYGAQAAAHVGVMEVSFADVEPGTYGVLVHHDSNDDGKIDKTLLGIPTEGVGFSRNPSVRFGLPSFADASLAVAGTQTSMDISLLFEHRENLAHGK